MISNLRSKPVEGHITDSAGNVLRNATVVIKQPTPSGSYIVDTIQSDDDGYFISKPISSGTYDVYESGIRVSRINHDASPLSIQCFKADVDNFNSTIVGNFETLRQSTPSNLNSYKAFIQIEPLYIDVAQFGNTFPIYNRDISSGTDYTDDLANMASFFELSTNSRVTTTRFDVEFFSPITALSSAYKRIRWAGVPAIRFYKDSRLVIPLDYFSIVPSMPKIVTPSSAAYETTKVIVTYSDQCINELSIGDSSSEEIKNLIPLLSYGDIVKIRIQADTPYDWYGIYVRKYETSSPNYITLEKWRSSRYDPGQDPVDGDVVDKIYVYDGMFQNISSINEEVNQKFTVTENIFTQDIAYELYNYSNRIY